VHPNQKDDFLNLVQQNDDNGLEGLSQFRLNGVNNMEKNLFDGGQKKPNDPAIDISPLNGVHDAIDKWNELVEEINQVVNEVNRVNSKLINIIN
jgi:hypothetical protein